MEKDKYIQHKIKDKLNAHYGINVEKSQQANITYDPELKAYLQLYLINNTSYDYVDTDMCENCCVGGITK